MRRFIGMPGEAPSINPMWRSSYSDAAVAHWMYCDPIEGALPEEGTNEAATDTRVLELLGVEPEIGAQFTMTVPMSMDRRPPRRSRSAAGGSTTKRLWQAMCSSR